MKKNIILLTNNEMSAVKGGAKRFEDIKITPAPPTKEDKDKKDKTTETGS